MARYVAFLRGVMPSNCSMPALKASLEAAGFADVRTLLSSGNVAFTTRATAVPALERRVEAAMQASLGRTFATIIRSSEHLQALVASDPFAAFALPKAAKGVVTFLKHPGPRDVALPIALGDARILAQVGDEVLTMYVPDPKGPDFMTLLERTYGKEITTRTLGTVEKCAKA